jgi:hypothetical protein
MPIVDLKEISKISKKRLYLQSLYDTVAYFMDQDATAHVKALEQATTEDELFTIHASFSALMAQHIKSLYAGDLVLAGVLQPTYMDKDGTITTEHIPEPSEDLPEEVPEDPNPFDPSQPDLNNLV